MTQIKQHINEVTSQFDTAFESKPHAQWEFLKYEIQKFSAEFSKNKAKLRREKWSRLEGKVKEKEQNFNNDDAKEQHNTYRGEISQIYGGTSNNIKIRNKCNWYEFSDKSNKFFLILEKRWATQNIVHKVLSNEQEIIDLSKINTHMS